MKPAYRGIVLCFAALALAALLNAQGLRKTAQTQPAGAGRDVALAVAKPLARVSSFLYLDRPRHELQVAIGRGDVDRIDTTVRIAAPATPTPARLPHPPPAKQHRATSKPRPKPAFSPQRPLRLWVAGDSLAQVPGEALERAAGTGGPVDVLGIESRLSTGLARPDLYNWFDRIAAAIPELHPDVAVFSFGADDAHDYMSGVPQGRTIGKLGSPSWDAEYRRRVAGVTRELNAAGIYVVWLGLPIPAGRGFHRSFHVVNGILERAAGESRTGAAYIDTWDLLATKSGRYADYLRDGHGHLVLMRARDGIHYTQPAGDLIARAVLQRLGQVYELRG
ncbi:MAG: SGNH/GDSL hydrolase family protein [Gaiellaceae bacterium]